MNYLAHLLLAEPTEDSHLGAWIGDFMDGRSLDTFSNGIQEGILLHRRIDRLTDTHPVFRRSRQRLRESMRHFSGVVVDVAYDHFLAASWERWHGESLRDFADRAYALLRRREDDLPERLRSALQWIVGDDWLASYEDRSHLERVFTGISRRVKRANPLPQAHAAVVDHYDELAADFAEFFPQLRSSSRRIES